MLQGQPILQICLSCLQPRYIGFCIIESCAKCQQQSADDRMNTLMHQSDVFGEIARCISVHTQSRTAFFYNMKRENDFLICESCISSAAFAIKNIVQEKENA